MTITRRTAVKLSGAAALALPAARFASAQSGETEAHGLSTFGDQIGRAHV